MTTLARQFAVVFFLGFVAFVVALGLGGMAGELLSLNVYLYSLRFAGLTFMAGGLALWIAKRRYEGGKPAINPLIVMLVVLGLAAVLIGLVYWPVAAALQPAGLAATGVALAIGFLTMLISPAGAKPLTAKWPEGGLGDPYAPVADHHAEPATSESADQHAH